MSSSFVPDPLQSAQIDGNVTKIALNRQKASKAQSPDRLWIIKLHFEM